MDQTQRNYRCTLATSSSKITWTRNAMALPSLLGWWGSQNLPCCHPLVCSSVQLLYLRGAGFGYLLIFILIILPQTNSCFNISLHCSCFPVSQHSEFMLDKVVQPCMCSGCRENDQKVPEIPCPRQAQQTTSSLWTLRGRGPRARAK